MVCDLTEESLFILNILYKNRSVRSNRGYNSEKLKGLFNKKFSGRDHLSFKDSIKILKNSGYITVIKKKDDKFYISNIKDVVLALSYHGYIPYDTFD